MTCTFFGHRDAPESVRPILATTIRKVIVSDDVRNFLVGYQGAFDRMVLGELKKMKAEFPWIRYTVVLAYLPDGKNQPFVEAETVYPEGLETVPRRFAIARRNEWMIKQADVVVSYVTHSTGGAAKYVQKAERQGKRIISVVS